MAYTPDDIYKLFIVKRTQVEMISDRGYLLPQDEINMFLEHENAQRPTPNLLSSFIRRYTPQESKTFSREALSSVYADEKDKKIYVYFTAPTAKEKQGVAVINAFIETITEIKADLGIIITNEGFTSDAKKALSSITQPSIQVFFDYQLYANPTHHVYVPRHTRLDEDTRRAFLIENKLQPRQLLAMSIDDPIVRYYGWNTGDIIRIERFNLATNKTMVKSSLAYRVVSKVRIDQERKKATKAKVVS